jgi:hypothetical protein
MKRIFTLLATALLLILISSCSKKSSNPSDDDLTQKELQKIDSIMTTQVDLDSPLQGLLVYMDSTAAKDSVVKVFLADPNVQSAQSTSQGITVQYTNGMRGGILLDPKDGVASSDKATETMSQSLGGLEATGRKPVSKKTKMLTPSFWERSQWANPLRNTANTAFAKAGYDAFESVVNHSANLNEFTSLSGYGIVHIYSHGWAWPNDISIQEVYLLTGEAASPAATKKYLADIQKGKIMMGAYHGLNRYWISPSFFAAHNDFHDDTTLVYLGFCYSFCGGWQDTLTQIAGAGACVGFNWHVETQWNAAWARHLYQQMCDTSLARPMTVYDWWYAESDTDNTYWDDEPECQKWVHVKSKGYYDLVLWSAVKIASISPDSGATDIPVTIRGSGFDYNQGTSTVTFGGITAEVAEWTDTLIVAQVPFEATSGDVVVTVGTETSNAVYYRVTNPVHTLTPCTSRHSTLLVYRSDSPQYNFELVYDFAFNGSVEGPGLVTEIDTIVWPYPETEPLNRYNNYSGTVGGPSPAIVTVRYALQTTINGQDASSASPVTLTKSFDNGNYWEVTVTPVYVIEYWNNVEHPWWEETEALPVERPIATGNPDHLILTRKLNIHTKFHIYTGFDITNDYSSSFNFAGITLVHR